MNLAPWPTNHPSLTDVADALCRFRDGMSLETWAEHADEELMEVDRRKREHVIAFAKTLLIGAEDQRSALVLILRTLSTKPRIQFVAALVYAENPWVKEALDTVVRSHLFEASQPLSYVTYTFEKHLMRGFVDRNIEANASYAARERTTRGVIAALKQLGCMEGEMLLHARPDPEVFAYLLAAELRASRRVECPVDWAIKSSHVARFFCLEEPYAQHCAKQAGNGRWFHTSYLAGTPRLVVDFEVEKAA